MHQNAVNRSALAPRCHSRRWHTPPADVIRGALSRDQSHCEPMVFTEARGTSTSSSAQTHEHGLTAHYSSLDEKCSTGVPTSLTRPVLQLLSSTVSTGEAATIVAAHRPLGRLDYGIQTYVQRRSSGRLRQFDSMGCRGWCSEDGRGGGDVDCPGPPEPLGHDRGEPRRRREQGPTWRRRREKRRRQKQGRGSRRRRRSRRRPLTSESLMLLAANTPSDTLGKRVAEGAIPQSLHRFQSRRRRAARSSTRCHEMSI